MFSCTQVMYSPPQCEGFGLSDGEVMKRLWSYLRRFSRMTKRCTLLTMWISLLMHYVLYYAFMSKQKLGILFISLHTICVVPVNIYLQPDSQYNGGKIKGDEGCRYSQLCTAHFSSSRLYTVSDTVYYSFCLASKKRAGIQLETSTQYCYLQFVLPVPQWLRTSSKGVRLPSSMQLLSSGNQYTSECC